jgi:1-acyl-sn-glycerol-3-phosphate acyltransferase
MAVNGTEGPGASGADQRDGAPPEHPEIEIRVDTRRTPVYRFLRFLVRMINLVYFRTSVEGAGRVPAEGPVVIAPVHRSFIDFFVVSQVTGRKLHYMAKDTLWRNARFGRFLVSVGAFPVHRESADREALRRAQAVLEAGEVLILFPEGERRSGPLVRDLHEGAAFLAARTGATIVPVGIGGTATVMPKGARFPRPRTVRIVVGDPLEAPARSSGGRIPRSRVHAVTAALAEAIQALYDQAVTRAGRA